MAKMGGLHMIEAAMKPTDALMHLPGKNPQDLQPLPASTPLTPMEMLGRALSNGATPDTLEKLLALQERWEKGHARKEFEAALAAASIEIVPVIKNRTVDFTSTKGRTNYRYEDLAAVERAVRPLPANNGINYRFPTPKPPNEPITVTCNVFWRGRIQEKSLSARAHAIRDKK